MTVRISDFETHCTHEASDILFKVKLGNALLRMLVVGFSMYLKSVKILSFGYPSAGHSVFT
jgi:hypothetical protein